jgi:Ni2+-binding GTPase involved in maturation of urease and hydrogenase
MHIADAPSSIWKRVPRPGQIVTRVTCHLEEQMIHQAPPEMDLGNLENLFVKNVGKFVWLVFYELGEDIRVTVNA